MKPIPALLKKSANDATLLICIASLFLGIDMYRRHNDLGTVITSDVRGYYM